MAFPGFMLPHIWPGSNVFLPSDENKDESSPPREFDLDAWRRRTYPEIYGPPEDLNDLTPEKLAMYKESLARKTKEK